MSRTGPTLCPTALVCLALVPALVVGPRDAVGRPVSTAPRGLSPPIARNADPHPAVVRVVVPERGATSYGSGTLVDVRGEYGLVMTNWHVVRDASGTIDVQFADGFRSAARALKVDRNWDLAALVIWRPAVQPVRLAPTAPRPGEPLTIAGYGGGRYRSMTGTCTQYVAPGLRLPYEMVEVSAAARQGDSGGPIFNREGHLAGVLFGSGGGTTTGAYCGRVGGFLATLAPDLMEGGTSQVASRPEPRRQRPAPEEGQPAAAQMAENPPGRPLRPHTLDVAPLPAAIAVGPPAETVDPDRPVSDDRGPWDRARTVLALVGGLAILRYVFRVRAGGEAADSGIGGG